MTNPTSITFDDLLRHGRRAARMTPAEFDYAVSWEKTSRPDLWRTAALSVAVAAGTDESVLSVVAEAVLNAHHDTIAQHVAAAQRRTYTGWSSAARARGQRVEYGDPS